MKIKVQDREYTDPKIIMKTSFRLRYYSIRFENLNGEDVSGWGHLNKEQAKRMIRELEVFLHER
ncbi:uncharacterized protein METZ01_LOCUS422541 [marine metagenome]|uniref:Uncharacterized protein n=1 Tax=marine metagenome TaxID=408172 RepID=A0A382XET6_9ZZZZ